MNDNYLIHKENTDNSFKFRPINTHLSKKFQKIRFSFQINSIDKTMALFKGLPSLKQYNLIKQNNRAYKLWCRVGVSRVHKPFRRL